MIVVIGSPLGRREADRVVAGGLASLVALEVAGAGRTVQVVGRIGDDAAADAVLQDLARGGVRHVAILRDPAHATPIVGSVATSAGRPEIDGADVELALRYLTDFAVLIVTDASVASVVIVAAQAADWGESALMVVRPAGVDIPTSLPADAIVIEPADDESDGAFASRVGIVATGLDAGMDRETALRAARIRSGG